MSWYLVRPPYAKETGVLEGNGVNIAIVLFTLDAVSLYLSYNPLALYSNYRPFLEST